MGNLNQLLLCMIAPALLFSASAHAEGDGFERLKGPLKNIKYDWPTKIFIDEKGKIWGKPARIESAYVQPFVPGEHLYSTRDWAKGMPERYVVVFEDWDRVLEGGQDASKGFGYIYTSRPRFFTFSKLEPRLVPLFAYSMKHFHGNRRGNPTNAYSGQFIDQHWGYGDIWTDDGKLMFWFPELKDRYPELANRFYRNIIKRGADFNPKPLDALEKRMARMGVKLHPNFQSADLGSMNQLLPFMGCLNSVRRISEFSIPKDLKPNLPRDVLLTE